MVTDRASPPHFESPSPRPLDGVTVIDAATLFAGPIAATMLADFGAEVIKVEHPDKGDPSRNHGYEKDGEGLWWKLLGRGKQPVTLNLSRAEGAELLLKLVEQSDVLIENFRPGTLERWGLGYDKLREVNPRIILTRVTGFGQFGPYSNRPGFGTLAEVMSGFAHVTGQPDGPPTLPPFGLADGIAGLTTAFAVMVALWERQVSGEGQEIDMAIIDPILTVVGAAPIVYDQLGIVQQRSGNRSVNNAPRNTYLTADDRWVAVSTSASSIAERVIRLVGRADLIDEPWFTTGRGRAQHVDEVDAAVADWIRQRPLAQVLEEFGEADAAIAAVYDAADILADPQYTARESIVSIEDPDLGMIRMQNVLFRLGRTPGAIRWTGRSKGSANSDVYAKLGLSDADIKRLQDSGVI